MRFDAKLGSDGQDCNSSAGFQDAVLFPEKSLMRNMFRNRMGITHVKGSSKGRLQASAQRKPHFNPSSSVFFFAYAMWPSSRSTPVTEMAGINSANR